jgi:hypothetical protein
MQAMAWCSVWLRVIRAEGTPRFVSKFLRRPGKYEKRFAARIIADADVAPNPSLADRIVWHSHIFEP